MKRIALTITILVTFLAGSVSVLIASWASAAAPAGVSGLRGDYFGDPNLASLKLTRNDAAINFEWRTGAVTSGVGPDNFSARWTGTLTPRFSETYTFFTQSDDGVRLWVDGRLLIDDWTRHGLTERKATIALQAGRAYDLRLEYFEYNVDATVRLLWSSQSQPKEIVPQSQLAPPGATAPTFTPRPAPSATATPAQPPAPSATATSAPAAGVYQVKPGDNWIEAEQPSSGMSGAWAIQGDASASGGRYVVTTATGGGTLGYRFQTDYAGPIYVWLRAIGAPGTTRPVKVQLDDGPQDSATVAGATWTWNLDDDAVYTIAPGAHTFRIIGRVAQVKIDRLLITTNPNAAPKDSAAPPTATAAAPTQPTLSPATATLAPTRTPSQPTPTQPSTGVPRLLFGIGPEANAALETRLAREAPVRMLTSWYNGASDLGWMAGWKNGLVPRAYADGYALHLVVFSGDAETQLSTQYGTACGRAYPLSDRFLGDMRQLAQIFAGTADGPPLYVTLFTEFQTYPCKDNAWNPDAPTNAYYRALKDRYLEALAIFHQQAPNARVSLGWGGWQTRWDDPATGAGRSMFQHFDDVLRASDFQSFQAMQSDSNVADVRAMVRTLGAYGPVMLAHYKPDNSLQTTFEQDLRSMLTESYLREVTSAGLFAWSFMDNKNLSASESIYQFTKDAIVRYGASAR